MKNWFVMSVLVLLLGLQANAQLTGRIKVIGVPDKYKISNKAQSSPGLMNAGVGQRIVMRAVVYGGGGGTKYSDTLVAITNAVWSITAKPTGSKVVLADTSSGTPSGIMFFVPDTVGAYTISMTATTSLGTAAVASLTVYAATFIGTGISAPATAGVANACLPCHQGTLGINFTSLLTTNHAQAVKRKMDDPTQHFSASCMSCHSAGYDGVPNSKNNGWDDLTAGADSTYVHWFPPLRPNGPGSYEGLAAANPNLMTRSGIQCENCHGPASVHMTTGDKTKLAESLSSDVCAPCHYSSDRHAIGYQWAATLHAVSTAEGSQLQYTDRFPCARCHTEQGYNNEVIGGLPQPSATISNGIVYSNPMPIGCSACHDPHMNNNPTQIDATTKAYSYPQLRVNAIGDVCTGCHITRLSTRGGLHTSHQGSMLIGINAPAFTLDNVTAYLRNSTLMSNNVGTWGGWELPGYTYENSSHSNITERCVTCHMADSPSYIANANSNFTIGDSMLTKLGRHTFMVSSTDSLGVTTLNPTGCTDCHGTVTMDFVESTQAKTQTMLNSLYALLPRRDSTISVADGYTNGSPISPTDTVAWQNSKAPASAKRALTTIERAAAYNFIFVKNDGSGGVHNFNYAKGLLESSIEQMTLGKGASTIVQIKDVPQDNGGAVQIIWNQFPAESFSFGRLTSYGVWRRDPILPALSKSENTITSFAQMLATASVGGRYTMGASVWTFVASVPVSGQTTYSFIAPTLFDSTKTGGQKYSAFFIAGNTSDGSNTVYQSPIDSGYSVNNLFPTAVVGVTGISSAKGVTLSWSQSTNPQDNDITRYLVFRGNVSGFVPNPASPYASVAARSYLDSAVTAGQTYYYRIAAIDKAGNSGPYSGEFSLKVTSVGALDGLPTEFALGQNYPNPFNPSTEIRFALPVQAHVTLTIYNVAGSLVRTVVNTEMPAGYYGATWNGTNDNGQSVSTGMYFYRLQAGRFVESKKLLLLK